MEKDPDKFKPVFFDERGRRRRYLNRMWLVSASITLILLLIFTLSIINNPSLPQIHLKSQPLETVPEKPGETTKQIISETEKEKNRRVKKQAEKTEKASQFF